jgi:hypothetical protein
MDTDQGVKDSNPGVKNSNVTNVTVVLPQETALWRVLAMLMTKQINDVKDMEMMLMLARNAGEAIIDNARTTGYLAELFKAAYGKDIEDYVSSCKAEKRRENPTMTEEFAELMCLMGLIFRIVFAYKQPTEKKLAKLTDMDLESEGEEEP